MANEKRLIDANDVYALFGANRTARLHVGHIDVLPRVDAVEVVRCMDCKHGELESDGHLFLCHHHGSDWNEGDHFCSYGERKGNGSC